ncbi:MAG: stage V sporulation protein B [Clostridiales bacterium]|nr:stage V sporulation protein B [Clostridiales bacterium]HBM79677.1 stage V sporulation protein B [Clostridiaceae bacterium]
MKKLTFAQNTLLLLISNIATGSLSFFFSIILSREIGAHGVGLYHMVMPTYSFFICFTCGGTATAISKIVAEKISKNNTRELFKSITASIAFFSSWSIFVSIFVVIFAPYISMSILKDERTYLAILMYIPAIIFITIGSILKGYFYGVQNSSAPAVIDIFEKFIRVVVLLALSEHLRKYGIKYQVAGAVLAMTAGEVTSTTLLYIAYKVSSSSVKTLTGKPDNVFQIMADVFKVSLPLCVNGFFSTMLGTFIAAMAPRRLQAAGFAKETALALYGKVSGMGLTIVMFPAIIIGAISIMLVPVISEASESRNTSAVNKRIYSVIKLAAVVAAVSAGLFFSMPKELGMMFYSRDDLGNIIFSLSFGLMASYIESTMFGILNGLGKQGILLRNTIILSIIDITILYIFLAVSKINIYAYAIDFAISPLVGCILNYTSIARITGIYMDFREIVLFPLLISFAEIIIINKLKSYMAFGNISTLILLFTGIAVYLLLYFILSPVFKRAIKQSPYTL